jgi:hypothetical protein
MKVKTVFHSFHSLSFSVSIPYVCIHLSISPARPRKDQKYPLSPNTLIHDYYILEPTDMIWKSGLVGKVGIGRSRQLFILLDGALHGLRTLCILHPPRTPPALPQEPVQARCQLNSFLSTRTVLFSHARAERLCIKNEISISTKNPPQPSTPNLRGGSRDPEPPPPGRRNFYQTDQGREEVGS